MTLAHYHKLADRIRIERNLARKCAYEECDLDAAAGHTMLADQLEREILHNVESLIAQCEKKTVDNEAKL